MAMKFHGYKPSSAGELKTPPRASKAMKMKAVVAAIALVAALAAPLLLLHTRFPAPAAERPELPAQQAAEILLPLPKPKSGVVLEEALLNRRSVREWAPEPLELEDLALLLWAAQGVTEFAGWYRRTAPSAGATYPLEVYVVVGERGVRNGTSYLEAGVYKYNPLRHSLTLVARGDRRRELWEAALRQDWVRDAPASIVICAVYERTTSRYGERGYRYVHMEAGHAGQNIYLQAAALGLGTVAVGAFDDEALAKAIGAQPNEAPLYVFPVGVPRERYRLTFEGLRELYEATRRG